MQSRNHFLDDLSKLLTNAAGAAQGLKQEIDSLVRTQAEKVLSDLQLVTRDEFEALRTLAVEAIESNSELRRRLEKLEKSKPKSDPTRKLSKPKRKS